MADRNGVAYSAFSGPRASYVALASMTSLGLVFLTSLWIPDVSGFVGILGLLAVYLPSKEFLTLYVIFAPTSLLIDVIRLIVMSKDTQHRGWLVFFALLAMIAKGAGGLFAWSLQRSINSDDMYGPLNGAPEPTPAASYQRDTSSPYTTFNNPRQEPGPQTALFPSNDHNIYVPPASAANP